MTHRADDEDDPATGAEEDEDVPAGRSERRGRRAYGTKPPHRRGLRAWDDPAEGRSKGEEPDEADDGDADEEEPRKRTVYLRARDTWWFEPLIAVMVIVVLLVALFAYTSNWPPVYVIESMSMQHGYDDQLGLINTGDLVLATHIDPSKIVPYVVGMQTGYSTYGEYGDVVLYHPNGDSTQAPIIHRALVFITYNPNGTYSFPELSGMPCGAAGNAVYAVSGTTNGCGTVGLKGSLSLYNVGWQSAEVDIPLQSSVLGKHSGYVTMGDNNFDNGNTSIGISDQLGALSTLVEPGWVLGVARGMIPWFGAVKLAIDGNASEVPTQSWQYMGLSLVGIFLAGLGLHLFLRREGIEDERRKRQDEAEEREAERSEGEGPPKHRWGRGLRLWGRDEDDDEEADEPEPEVPRKHPTKTKPRRVEHTSPRRGRPAPKIGRRHPSSDDDEDDEL